MADNTSVGSVSISLDLDVSSRLEKQVQDAATKVGKVFENTLNKGDQGKSMGESLIKSIDKSLSSIEKTLESLVNKASKVGEKMGKNISNGIDKSTENIDVKMPNPKTQPKQTRAGPKMSGITKDDLISRRDNSIDLQENINSQIELLKSRISKLKLEPNWIKTDKMEEDILRLEGKMISLTGKSDALTVDIANLDNAIDGFDTSQAAASQEALAKKMDEASKAVQRQKIEEERLSQAQAKTAASSDRPKQAQTRAATASEQLKQSQMRTQQMMDRVNKSAAKATNSVTNYGKGVKKANKPLVNMQSFGRSLIRQMLGLSLIIRLVGQAVRKMAQSFFAAMKTNSDFSNSLNQIKSNLATAFQPIFQAIMPAINSLMRGLSKATAYLAAFISMIFGKSVKASNASAKAMSKATKGVKGYSKAAKEAQQITAGFDQLHDITESKDSGSDGSSGSETGENIVPVNIDESELKGIEKFMAKVKDIISKAFDASPVKAFTNLVITFFTQMYASISRIGGAIGANLVSIWEAMFPNIQTALGNISELWTNVFDDISNFIAIWFPLITDQIVIFIDNVFSTFEPFFVLLSQMWMDWTKILLDTWDKYGSRILNGIGEFITGAIDTFNKIWTHIIDPILKPAIELLKEIWDNHLKLMLKELIDFVASSVARALEFYNKFIKPIVDWLVVTLGPIVAKIFNVISSTITGVLGGVIDTVRSTINNIKKIFNGVLDFFEGVFTGNWKKAFQGLVDVVSNIFAGFANIILAPIRWILDGINGFIRGLNKIKIPKWVPGVGGKGIDIPEIPNIPHFARGAVLKQPTLNISGEYPGARSNPEIVTPQNILKDSFREVLSEFLAAFKNGLGMGGVSEQSINLVVNIGGMKLLDIIIDLAKEYTRQTGKELIFNVT